MAQTPNEEALYTSEQRKYRRLEASLPVWLADAAEFDSGGAQWSLGFSRDVSMGGAKIIVPTGEEERWREAASRAATCLLRYDAPGCSTVSYISGRVRHAAREQDTGRLWLGVEYEDGADEEKAASLRAGLQSLKQRRRLQGVILVGIILFAFTGLYVFKLRADAAVQQARVAALQKRVNSERKLVSRLMQGGLVATRAQGIDQSFSAKAAKAEVARLTADLNRLANPDNKDAVERERANKRAAEGIILSTAPATGVNVNLGVALPYGYAWPQAVDNVEQLIGRQVPTVVIFRDFKSEFPLADAREARLRAKTLQITWEPWHYSNPSAIKLSDIARGKHDKYIDRWANAAKSFGGEIWIRFAHEFNGNWYPWSTAANGRKTDNYKAAFRHVHDRFDRAGAFNVRWIWCMNAETVPNVGWNDPDLAYPGPAYVDMISIDGYNFGASLPSSRWISFEEIFAIPYLKAVKNYPNKPIMIGETSCSTVGGPTGTGRDKANWIRAMDKTLRTKFKRVSGVVWFEVQKEADWRMASSLDSLQASRAVWNQTYYKSGVS